ncbi:MAG: prepilin-type N-terminal cleavage/methylation domain-containing protein [Acidimicrobiales bacterium]|jgi:prepilin-type N-terminal cleavage/methylation domain-containing protein
MKNIINNKRGFTLLEILLVVAAISILAGIVIVALNPAKQLGDTRNAERSSDVNTILNAIHQYTIDNDGILPAGIDANATTYQVLGTVATGADSTCAAVTTEAAAVDLTTELVPTYVVGIPMDPSTGTLTNTDYYVNRNAAGRIEVGACDPEQAAVITITR